MYTPPIRCHRWHGTGDFAETFEGAALVVSLEFAPLCSEVHVSA
jgi:hypothetical protein